MQQLFRAIGVACTSWILFSACSAAPPPPRGNVEHYRYTRRMRPVSYNYDAYSFHPSSQFLGSVPSSRSDMAPNASPFQMSPFKNPLYMRSLIDTVSSKLAQGAYASKRYDIPNVLTPPGGHFGGPGAAGAGQLFFLQPNLGAPQQAQALPLLPSGYGIGQHAFASGPAALPPQAPFQGNPLSADEFQHYLKAAAAPLPAHTNAASGAVLSQDDFQKYLKVSTKKTKANGPSLSPEEFQKFVLAAQETRDSELLKNGKSKPGKLQTLTPEDFKKFFSTNKDKQAIAGPGQYKKHKRGHNPSAGHSSGGYPSGPSSYSDYPAPPPAKYGPPPQQHHSNPPPEAYPDFYPQQHIETEDEATKRSVLDALWRAFQAIAGGALTIGGQIAKGSGTILQAKGKLIASAGPVVSEFGKTIATKAAIPSYVPTYSHGTPYHSEHHVEEYHSSHPSLLQTAYDVASTFKVAALGTTKAVADLVSQLSSASAKAYLLKE